MVIVRKPTVTIFFFSFFFLLLLTLGGCTVVRESSPAPASTVEKPSPTPVVEIPEGYERITLTPGQKVFRLQCPSEGFSFEVTFRDLGTYPNAPGSAMLPGLIVDFGQAGSTPLTVGDYLDVGAECGVKIQVYLTAVDLDAGTFELAYPPSTLIPERA